MNPTTGKCSTCGDFARDCVCDDMPFIEEVFTIDDCFTVAGIHDPSVTWNGWACPFFPIESVEIISQWVESIGGDAKESGYPYVIGGRVFWFNLDGVSDYEVLPVAVDGVEYFEIGSHGWIWDVWEGEEV